MVAQVSEFNFPSIRHPGNSFSPFENELSGVVVQGRTVNGTNGRHPLQTKGLDPGASSMDPGSALRSARDDDELFMSVMNGPVF